MAEDKKTLPGRSQGRRLLSSLTHSGMRKRVLAPVSFDALILGTNLITGIIIARSLGPSGRGELAAILTLVQMAAWIFSIGGAGAVAYHQARHPHEGGQLIGAWLAISLPLSVVAILIGELVIPTLFSAQIQETVDIGRVYMLVVIPQMLGIVFNGILLGDERPFAYGLVRLTIPVLIVVAYLFLLLTSAMTVESALVANAIAVAASTGLAATVCIRRHSLARPTRALVRGNLWYGLRAHTGLLAGFVSGRLDLLIIPAYLAAASVGLYSIATNVASIIATLTGTLAVLALPAAARNRERSARTVVRTLHATFLIGGVLGTALFVLAEPALTLVYGSRFGSAADALRILLPGEVLSACAVVMISGLLAADRPLLASAPAIPGALLTVVGLLLFLPDGTIVTAAVVTTISYAAIFIVAILLYRNIADLKWRQFLRAPRA